MENQDKPSKARRPSHQMLSSMRGNLRQILSVPEEERTESQRKAIIKISGAINHARNEQLEKGRKAAERIRALESSQLIFDNPAYVLMVLRALAYIASDEDYLPGIALRDMCDENPFMSSAALDQLEGLEYIRRLPDGALVIENKGRRLLDKRHRKQAG